MDWDAILRGVNREIFLLGDKPVSLATLVQLVLLVLAVGLLARAVRSMLLLRILARTRLDPGQQYALARISGYAVIGIGLLIGLSTIGVDLTSLTVLLGALGVGIGFGLQNIVKDFVSGLILLLERPFQIGHRVDVGATAGRVTEIGARSTTIITNDNIAIVVPNSRFIEEQVTNWSLAGDRRVRFKLPVGVSYGSKPREVQRLLLDAAREDADTLADPAPNVVFAGFGESSLDFELRVWTSTFYDRPFAYRSKLYFAIWERFEQHGIEIPFPQRDVHVDGQLSIAPPAESSGDPRAQ